MTDIIDWRLIDRHLTGMASADDEQRLRDWLAEDPQRATWWQAFRDVATVGGAGAIHWDVERAWSQMAIRLNAGETSASLRPAVPDARALRSPARWTSRRVMGAAAAAILAVGLFTQTGRFTRTAESVGSLAASDLVAPNGHQRRVTLSDGTAVLLNAGSRLRVAAQFGQGARDVTLEGEGYFDVVHDSARPFLVHVRDGVAEDLGTQFVVRAYPELTRTELVVASGSVAIQGARDKSLRRIVAAGQHGRLERDGTVSVVDEPDVDRWMSWRRGELVFDGVTLNEAAATLTRRFDVPMVITDSLLGRRRVSARFHAETLPQMLDALSMVVNANWTRDGLRIVIAKATP